VSYEVFARKYRPQTFDDLVGQAHVSRTLKNAVAQNRLAHAYLFVGPRGIGKTSTARILAKALNCVKGPTVTPDGTCDNCLEIAAGNSLDVLEIDGASNNGVEQVRELRENVRYAPSKSRYKIYIIDEVHMLTAAAFNALLKTLEEPPPHVKFIFATTEPQKVLATIVSRCQRFDLHRIPAKLIAEHLQFKAKPDALQEDVDPELQKALAAQADLIENERLLELIDQFAQAEGRMKWAPNKKLHFEVAIIKAIQSLNQATLDEVIEKLGELRDGKTSTEKKTLAAAPERSAKQSSVVAAVSAASPAENGEQKAPRVAESANGDVDVEKIWRRAFSKIPNQKAFVRNSAAVAHVLPSEGRHFVLGFSPDQKSPMGILGTAANRKLIETLLSEVSGKDWTLKLTVRDNLVSKVQPAGESASENYADDPLIREALQM